MSIKRGLLTFGVAVVAVSVLLAGTAYASSVKSGDSPEVASDQSVDGTLYISGATVTIAGNVNGDVFCVGQTVEISGSVDGDVICAAQTLRITGEVGGNVRAAAQTMNISAKIGSSATLFAQTLTVEDDATVGRDLTAYGQVMTLEGKVGRDVMAGGQQANIGGTVGRDVDLQAEAPKLLGGATVGGDFTYTSDQQLSTGRGSDVQGDVVRKEASGEDSNQPSGFELLVGRLLTAAYVFAALFIVGGVLRWLAPKSYGAVRSSMVRRPLAAFGIGLGVMAITPLVIALLLVSGIGILLAGMLLLVMVLVLIGGLVYGLYGLGHFVVKHIKAPSRGMIMAALSVGIALFALSTIVPFLGGVVFAIAMLWGAGGVVLALVEHRAAGLSAEATQPSKNKRA